MNDRIYIPEKKEEPLSKTPEKAAVTADVTEAMEIPDSTELPVSAETTAPAEASAETALEAVPVYRLDEAEAPKPPRKRLFASLTVTVLSAVAITVYGVAAADTVTEFKTPLSHLLAGDVFGTGITSLPGTYTAPPLQLIPPQTVEEGEMPGAAEHETAPETQSPRPTGELPIQRVDLSAEEGNPFALVNETPYTPDVYALLGEEPVIPPLEELHAEYGKDAPTVLILHTHGTEAFSPEGAETYDSSCTFRSHDPDESVVAVGRVIKEELTARGIGVIHLENMFDLEDYNSAYYKAASEIRRITEEYPSVRYVLDIHRDAMITSEGVSLAPVSDAGEAQVMFVIGTDHAGSGHVTWRNNLSLALRLQESLISKRRTLMRALNLRSASFNGQYTPGSLLIEVGAAGNSLSEAKSAAVLLSEAVAEEIIGK